MWGLFLVYNIYNMPELPEVETIRRGLSDKILNKKIINIEVRKPNLLRNKIIDFKTCLKQNSILSINRIGKLLIFNLADNNYLLIHLKMTGQLIYSFKNGLVAGGHQETIADELPSKYSYIIFNFIDGSSLFFNDMRQFGYLQVVDSVGEQVSRAKFGIEPLTKNFTLKRFKGIMEHRRGVLKALLLNQQIIAGIGNIYADEICFRAKILPTRTVDSLADSEIKKLYQISFEDSKLYHHTQDKKNVTFTQIEFIEKCFKIYDEEVNFLDNYLFAIERRKIIGF